MDRRASASASRPCAWPAAALLEPTPRGAAILAPRAPREALPYVLWSLAASARPSTSQYFAASAREPVEAASAAEMARDTRQPSAGHPHPHPRPQPRPQPQPQPYPHPREAWTSLLVALRSAALPLRDGVLCANGGATGEASSDVLGTTSSATDVKGFCTDRSQADGALGALFEAGGALLDDQRPTEEARWALLEALEALADTVPPSQLFAITGAARVPLSYRESERLRHRSLAAEAMRSVGCVAALIASE